MATVQELNEKVAKANEKVQKARATLEKHKVQLQKKLDKGITGWEIESKKSDIKGATNAVENAEAILKNWQAKLKETKSREAFIAKNTPKVIKEFLEEWKKLAHEWHMRKLTGYRELKAKLEREERELLTDFVLSHPEIYDPERYTENGKLHHYYEGWNMHNINPRKPWEDHLKEHNLDGKSIKEKLFYYAGMTVIKMHEMYDDKEAEKWLLKQLEEEKKRKMVDLIQRIQAVTGTITDAKGLSIRDTNLNGIVVGEKGQAKVETITAGGWNIQCWHYRTLVHEIKDGKKKAVKGYAK